MTEQIVIFITMPNFDMIMDENFSNTLNKFINMVLERASSSSSAVVVVDHGRFFSEPDYQYEIRSIAMRYLSNNHTLYTNLPSHFLDMSYKYRHKIKSIYEYVNPTHGT